MEYNENYYIVEAAKVTRLCLKMSSNTRTMIISGLILLVLAIVSFREVQGHVALTFPRARKYDLDFLDNARTPGPCGMPRGKCYLLLFFILNFLSLSYLFKNG